MSVEWPPTTIWERHAVLFVYFLNALGRTWPGSSLRVSSFYRDPETNIRVSGAIDSQHLLGLAIDVVGEESQLIDFASQVRVQGLIPVMFERHLHVQTLPAGTARQAGLFA